MMLKSNMTFRSKQAVVIFPVVDAETSCEACYSLLNVRCSPKNATPTPPMVPAWSLLKEPVLFTIDMGEARVIDLVMANKAK